MSDVSLAGDSEVPTMSCAFVVPDVHSAGLCWVSSLTQDTDLDALEKEYPQRELENPSL